MKDSKFPKSDFQKERELWWRKFGEEHRNKFHLEFIDYILLTILCLSLISTMFLN